MSAFTETHRLRAGSQIILLLILAVMVLPWLGETVFYSKGEPREAILAVAALDSGDWLLPTYYGDELPFKPPFLGWLIAAFAWIFNGGVVTEYISRLPSALAMILMCWGIMRWAGRWRGERFGFICALIAPTMFEVFRAGTGCRLDMVLTAAMSIAMFMMFNLRERRSSPNRFWKYLAVILLLTIATMTKGPVGAFLPCFIMGIYSLLRGDRFFPTLAKYLGLALAAIIIPAIWAYLAWLRGGQRFLDLMLEENFGRLFGTMSYESHVNPWWYNFVSLLGGMAPWTLFMALAAIDFRRYRRAAFKPLGIMSFTAVVIVIIFFTIPESKRSVYLLPAYPFLAYWIACTLTSLADTKVLRFYTWFLAVLAIMVVAAIITLRFVTLPGLTLDTPSLWIYPLLAIPLCAALRWMFKRRSAPLVACLITASLFMAYLAIVQPMVMNPRSDKRAVGAVIKAAPEGPVYSIDATYPPVRYYTINYYIGDRMRRAASFESLDSMPSGTVVLFRGRFDYPGGIPTQYEVTQLLDKSTDNRNPLMMGIRK